MAKKTSYRGFALPAKRLGGGYFNPKEGIDRVWSDLMITILTPIGSRPMRRSFGSSVGSLLFGQATVQDDPSIALEVTDAATEWCPQANVTAVRSVPPTTAGAPLSLEVVFSITGQRASLSGQVVGENRMSA